MDRELIELAERCEKAEGPHRLIDAAIEIQVRRWQAYACGLNDNQRAHWTLAGSKGEVIDTQGATRYHSPTYSFNMDAAALLVPDGFFFDTQSILRGTATFDRPKAWAQVEETSGPIIETSACATLPLAICAAALRARSHKGNAE